MKALPDSDKWYPSNGSGNNLSSAYLKQCQLSEDNIRGKYQAEKRKNIANFDSGTSLEEIIAEEFQKLFPKRYKITNGKVIDSNGSTSGHCDIIFFNEIWFPIAWPGSVNNPSKQFFPIDGIYAIGEIKSTLNFETLDAAFAKLVTSSRLNRLRTKNKRLVENRESTNCVHGLSNPLYTFIIAENLDDNININEIVERFIKINKGLKRLEMVRGLCILGHGTLLWTFKNEDDEIKPALFMEEDLYKELYPCLTRSTEIVSSLYTFLVNIQTHLFHSVLASEDFASYYGKAELNSQFAMNDLHLIPAAKEWLDLSNTYCDDFH